MSHFLPAFSPPVPVPVSSAATAGLLSLLPAAFDSSSTDYDVIITVRHFSEGKEMEDQVSCHRSILTASSPLFRSLLALSPPSLTASSPLPVVSVEFDLRSAPNALNAFRTMINTLYTGELNYKFAQPAEVLTVSRVCQVPAVESKVLSLAATSAVASPVTSPLSLFLANFQRSNFPETTTNVDVHSCLQAMVDAFLKQNIVNKDVYEQLLHLQLPEDDHSQPQSDSHSELSSPRNSAGSSPKGTIAMCLTDEQPVTKTVPLDEKEGWCRNKKYIEKTENGFMCTVCRKIYGRYNSVSYHVTIYHRNPPIKCTEPGCHFSTREARYIHFHKYYRHHIPLPNNIDLGSRKCPHCRHVSKSPAMLEKHIARHGLTNGGGSSGGKKEKIAEKRTEQETEEIKRVASSSPIPLTSNLATLLNANLGVALSGQLPCSLCPLKFLSQTALLYHIATCHAVSLFNSPPIHVEV